MFCTLTKKNFEATTSDIFVSCGGVMVTPDTWVGWLQEQLPAVILLMCYIVGCVLCL